MYVSLSRASLELLIKDEKSNFLRKVPFETDIIINNKVEGKMVYKLPETRTLPSSPFYGIKKMRDYLWIKFIKKPEDKARLLLLIADKQMGEVLIMKKKGIDKQMLIGTMIEAADKLKLASEGLEEISVEKIEVKEIKKQIQKSKYVYKKIIESIEIEEEERKEIIENLE